MDQVHGFIVDASSSFNSEFDDLFRAGVDEWLDSMKQNEAESED